MHISVLCLMTLYLRNSSESCAFSLFTVAQKVSTAKNCEMFPFVVYYCCFFNVWKMRILEYDTRTQEN